MMACLSIPTDAMIWAFSVNCPVKAAVSLKPTATVISQDCMMIFYSILRKLISPASTLLSMIMTAFWIWTGCFMIPTMRILFQNSMILNLLVDEKKVFAVNPLISVTKALRYS